MVKRGIINPSRSSAVHCSTRNRRTTLSFGFLYGNTFQFPEIQDFQSTNFFPQRVSNTNQHITSVAFLRPSILMSATSIIYYFSLFRLSISYSMIVRSPTDRPRGNYFQITQPGSSTDSPLHPVQTEAADIVQRLPYFFFFFNNCVCTGRVPDPTSLFLPTSFCM